LGFSMFSTAVAYLTATTQTVENLIESLLEQYTLDYLRPLVIELQRLGFQDIDIRDPLEYDGRVFSAYLKAEWRKRIQLIEFHIHVSRAEMRHPSRGDPKITKAVISINTQKRVIKPKDKRAFLPTLFREVESLTKKLDTTASAVVKKPLRRGNKAEDGRSYQTFRVPRAFATRLPKTIDSHWIEIKGAPPFKKGLAGGHSYALMGDHYDPQTIIEDYEGIEKLQLSTGGHAVRAIIFFGKSQHRLVKLDQIKRWLKRKNEVVYLYWISGYRDSRLKIALEDEFDVPIDVMY